MDPHAGECMDALIEADECISMFDKQDEQEMRDHKHKVVGQVGYTIDDIGIAFVKHEGHVWVVDSEGAAPLIIPLTSDTQLLLWCCMLCLSGLLRNISFRTCLGGPQQQQAMPCLLLYPLTQ